MKIAILGPQGCGKTTEAKRLSEGKKTLFVPPVPRDIDGIEVLIYDGVSTVREVVNAFKRHDVINKTHNIDVIVCSNYLKAENVFGTGLSDVIIKL